MRNSENAEADLKTLLRDLHVEQASDGARDWFEHVARESVCLDDVVHFLREVRSRHTDFEGFWRAYFDAKK